MLCTKDNFMAYSMAHTAFTCQVNTREKEIYKYIFSLIYNSVQIHPKSKCCAPACLCCTCFFLQRNSNQNFFYFHHMMPKFSCYSFMSARTLAKILNYLRGKYPPCQLLLAENAFFLLFQRLALLFQFGRWNPSCPSVQSFNSHIRSILLPIYFLFLLIRAFSTFASNVLFHAHQNSVDIYIFIISKTVKVSCSAASNV